MKIYEIIEAFLSLFTGGWVFIHKGDRRFFESSVEASKIDYAGDEKVAFTSIFTRRGRWDTWIVVRLGETSPCSHLAIDNFADRRLVCLRHELSAGRMIAFRVGREAATALFVSRACPDVQEHPEMLFVARVSEHELRIRYPGVIRA
ncbi:MAG: hypothetical protein KBD73_02560 [Candidatus Magasanikbacteria bacterium]|nr:hypothetical protein [Candidatus Magasanikbacteria bacterium]